MPKKAINVNKMIKMKMKMNLKELKIKKLNFSKLNNI